MASGMNGAQESNGVLAEADANALAASSAQASGISADEIALYDRQIRLWGVQAQERIRSANVLLVSIKALGTEIAKNLVLNGIKSLTIVDHETVTDDDLGAQYFLREEDIGSNRAQAALPRVQELNPRVTVKADGSDIMNKRQDFYHQFDMIIATDLQFTAMTLVNTAARMALRPFYAAGVHGFYGFIFADLIEHEYIIEREQSNVITTIKPESTTRSVIGVATKRENGKSIETVTKKEIYSHILMANSSPLPQEYLRSKRKMRGVSPLLPTLRALWDFERTMGRRPALAATDLVQLTKSADEKLKELQMPSGSLTPDFMRNFAMNIGSEIMPVAAFVGGRLSEDVINVLGKREQPLQNLSLFDGENMHGPIYALHPIFQDDLTTALPANGGTLGSGATINGTTNAANMPIVNNGAVSDGSMSTVTASGSGGIMAYNGIGADNTNDMTAPNAPLNTAAAGALQ